MVHVDGTGRHTHELSNFVSSNATAPAANATAPSGNVTGGNVTGGGTTSTANATGNATTGNTTTSGNTTTLHQTITGGNASSNNTIFLFGKVDVAKDGQPKWTGVDALIIVDKNNVISISLATKDTDGHFKGQPIYGIVESMKDANGNELVATAGGTQTAGNATSGAAGGNATTGGNQTGGNPASNFLGNITQGIQNLTGGGKSSGK
jgi:hypothetical protein